MARVHLEAGAIAKRDTTPWPMWQNYYNGGGNTRQAIPKPSPQNLVRFAENPIARRAINCIKNPIASLDWKIVPADGLKITPDMKKRAAIATNCLRSPNPDDSFRSLIEQVIEDTLTTAGAVEAQLSSDTEHPLWLYPVDGSSIRLYPLWDGKPNTPRYAQYTGMSGKHVDLRNDELIYIRINPRTSTPFGLTPMETAFNLITAFVSSFTFAQNVAGNGVPRGILDLGPDISTADVNAFRTYWQNDVEGQGRMPIFGAYAQHADKSSKPIDFIKLFKGDDAELRLKWQEWLVRLIAMAFGLSPQKLNLETSVNRATAEEMAEADDDGTIIPMAHLIAEHITREAIGRKLGWYDLKFKWQGLDPDDDESRSKIHETYIGSDVMTPNEVRSERGLPPLPDGWGDMTSTMSKIIIAQAAGSKAETQDPYRQDLAQQGPTPVPAPASTPAAGTATGPDGEMPTGHVRAAAQAPTKSAQRLAVRKYRKDAHHLISEMQGDIRKALDEARKNVREMVGDHGAT